jgi:photosystem II stability/assembly factor-like uncharacterized protein
LFTVSERVVQYNMMAMLNYEESCMNSRVLLIILVCLATSRDAFGQPSITILSPRDFAKWTFGAAFPIRWAVTDVDTLRIDYSATGPAGPWISITAGVPSALCGSNGEEHHDTFTRTGSFYWYVLGNLQDTIWLRVSDQSNNAPFVVKRIAIRHSNWIPRISDVQQSLYSTAIANDFQFWAAGEGGLIMHTTDGGTHWTVASMLEGDIHVVVAYDFLRYLACTSTGDGLARIHKTTDGGNSWTIVDMTRTEWRSIQVFNSSDAYALGDPDGGFWVLKRTTDGGRSWFTVQPALPAAPEERGEYSAMTWTDASHGWFGTNTNKLYRTTDGGATWLAAVLPPITSDVSALYFHRYPASLTGLIGSSDGAIRRTSDGGVTWSEEISRLPSGVLGLGGLLFSGECWAMSGGSIYYSQDTGRSWRTTGYDAYDGSTHLNQFFMSGASYSGYGCAVGDSGTIVSFRRYITDVYPPPSFTPNSPELEQNYPNPFNPSTTIRYGLPHSSHVTLTVYNTLGQQVAQLVNEQQQAGFHDAVFLGDGLASGVYFYRLQAGDYTSTRKLLLLR